ncbi:MULTISPECIES: RDD family protein [unclassified Arthrobacter]|uniref:RDD family protein n=1 Tax=unclassified Arthrobacter TaxID=235627 RepID=UPI0014915917|nr:MULTISPECIES: RDD family protein [unclassified Arthrobacter]MBE0009033.1 RDD family protein [Arthrobacter sp. AET 35A]NOJ60791.1 RDD family protein [Arthrobacter sp. 260]NOJ62837.1 RDD family protein [Arthrobacter sp. 147(2020)]
MSSVVTGEAVVLELRPASFGARSISLLIDIVAQAILVLAIVLGVSSTLGGSFDPALTQALVLVLLVLVVLVVPVTVETVTRGKSLGRLVMGLRIVRDDGGAIRFRHAFIRGMVGVLEIYLLLGSLAFLVAVFNERSKRLGDLLAGTYSMHERVVEKPRTLAVVPPQLAGWLATADVMQLPDALARRVTAFIGQASRLTPLARHTLAVDLATEVSSFVAPPPPAGTHPEDFLNAVLAERRNRDLNRLRRQRERTTRTTDRLHKLPFGQ